VSELDAALRVVILGWLNEARALDGIIRGFDTDTLHMARAAALRECAADVEDAMTGAGRAGRGAGLPPPS
jgi:hypothetical protein